MYIYDSVTSIFLQYFQMTEVQVEEFKRGHGSVYTNFRLKQEPGLKPGPGGGVHLPCVWGEAWTHGCMSLSDIQKFKLMVSFFSTPIKLIFFGGTSGHEDLTRVQNPCP